MMAAACHSVWFMDYAEMLDKYYITRSSASLSRCSRNSSVTTNTAQSVGQPVSGQHWSSLCSTADNMCYDGINVIWLNDVRN